MSAAEQVRVEEAWIAELARRAAARGPAGARPARRAGRRRPAGPAAP